MTQLPEPSQVPMPASANDEESIDIRHFFSVALRYKWSILGLAVAVGILAALITLTLPPKYSAQATILIESNRSKPVSIESVYGESITDQFYLTQVEIIRSRQVIARLIDHLALDHEQLLPPDANNGDDGGWQDMLPEWLMPAREKVELSAEQKRQAAIGIIYGNLDVTLISGSQLAVIAFESYDPKLAALIPNQLAETYIEMDLEARMQMVERASNWLTQNLEGLRGKLERSEQALQEFRDKERLVDVGGVRSVSTNQLQEISTDLVDVRRKRAEAETIYRQTRALRDNPLGGLESVPAILRHPLVQSLKQSEVEAERVVKELSHRYGPKHPKMIAAKQNLSSVRRNLRSQILTVVDGIETDYRVALNNERALNAELGQSTKEVQQVSKKEYQYNVLAREVETNKQLYDLFLTRFKETDTVGDFQTTIARVVDMATVPSIPFKPRKKMIVALATFLAGIIGILLALLRDHLDNTVTSGEQIEAELGLNALGIVPFIGKRKHTREKMGRALVDNADNGFSEAIKSIRTSVMLSGIDDPHQILLVTSAVPGEGKTTVSTNLSVAIGQMERVLLIDADLRRPSVGKSLGIDSKHPGLSDLVAGLAPFEECVVRFEDAKIDVIPAGQIPPNPLEIISTKRFKATLTKLAEHYDRIIIDAPPESAVSDPLVLSTYANAVVLVVKVDSTPKDVVAGAVKKLQHVDAPLLGVVLNQFMPRKHGYYGYYGGRYYRYGADGSYGKTTKS